MKAKTIAHCFGLLIILLSACLVGEFLFAVFTGGKPQSIHKSFPLVTFPALVKEMQHPEGTSTVPAEIPPRLQIRLKNGRVITGEKVSENAEGIHLKVDGSAISFVRSEIENVIELAPSTDA